MHLSPFHIDTSQVETLTSRQMETVRLRIAQNFGARAEYSPLVYVMLLCTLYIGLPEARVYIRDYWALVLALFLVSFMRVSLAKKLSVADKQSYISYLNSYYLLTLSGGLLWGILIAQMIWMDKVESFSYLLLVLFTATTAGAQATLASYYKVVVQFIALKWLPIFVVFIMLGLAEIQYAFLFLSLALFLLVFVVFQSRRISMDFQTIVIQQVQLEGRTNELYQALHTIEQQQTEVRQHRDHLQELVDEKTADLNRAKIRAEEADIAKSEFLANMSHELRTPLHSILSFSQFGMERLGKVDNEKIRDYLEKIHYSGEIQLSLVNNLLDLARLESSMEELHFKAYNLYQLIKNVVAEVSSLYEDKSIRVSVIAEQEELDVLCDNIKIMQLVRNLLSNAIKFSPQGSEITIICEKNDDWVIMIMQDQGPGVPDEEKELIFDKFNQSSRTRTGAGGTGLGLAICAQIIQLHKGRLWVEDGEQQGALFKVLLPAISSTD